MKEQIQQLIATGQTEEALQLLVKSAPDAILLQARYNQGKKQYNMGLIEFGEWSRIQAQINYAALELAGSAKTPATHTSTEQTHTSTDLPSNAKKVFISYNHADREVARQVRTFLETKHIHVIIDEDDLAPGQSILEFIQQGIKKSDAVVSIVSSESLRSGWVGQESVASMYAVWLADKKFIPVKLDNVVFDIDFQISATEGLNLKIKELKAKIKKLESLGVDSPGSRDDLARMVELKNNLGKIIQRFTSVFILDISGNNFDPSMTRVLAAL
jgi:TIR domain/Effector-associated domain 11